MARNSKDGKESDAAKKLLKEQEATDKAQAALETEMQKVEAAKLKAAKEESDNQAAPIATVSVADKERKARWDKLVAGYAEKNPVKYAEKKKRGEFDTIPPFFSGGNQMNITM